jgi:hypothetical protein
MFIELSSSPSTTNKERNKRKEGEREREREISRTMGSHRAQQRGRKLIPPQKNFNLCSDSGLLTSESINPNGLKPSSLC